MTMLRRQNHASASRDGRIKFRAPRRPFPGFDPSQGTVNGLRRLVLGVCTLSYDWNPAPGHIDAITAAYLERAQLCVIHLDQVRITERGTEAFHFFDSKGW